MVIPEGGLTPMSPRQLLHRSPLAEATMVSFPSVTSSPSADQVQRRQRQSLVHVVTDGDISPVRSSSGMPLPFARKRGSRLSQSNGTISEDLLEESADGTISTPTAAAATNKTPTTESMGPRYPNSFVSRRVVSRAGPPSSFLPPTQLQPFVFGEARENGAFVSSLHTMHSSNKHGSNSFRSVKDECMTTFQPQSETKLDTLSSIKTPEPLSCVSSQVESSSSCYRGSQDTLSTAEFYPLNKPISQGTQGTPHFFKNEGDQQVTSDLMCMEAIISKSTERERRRGIIGSPRVVSRGERKGWEAKQRGGPLNEINLKKDEPAMFTTERSNRVGLCRKNEEQRTNKVQVYPCCPATPLSVMEEMMWENDEGNPRNHLENLHPNKEPSVLSPSGVRCSGMHSPVYFTGETRGLQFVRRVVTEKKR
ncbi:uncharacterized protein TM35_000011620 [Trypanosoma theileri]|uniref:Uncharacterized protein n=1 Tax=Trypanosoma theileri TaxID=67003 RepID=A0A1X0P8Y6_9TRYP|nr:uncharacterized protein TM35_000011620 [Trypanosoma theileri]ORC93285.1 hypothetical protein TM35_000011620 [Trypanosoma theileri]